MPNIARGASATEFTLAHTISLVILNIQFTLMARAEGTKQPKLLHMKKSTNNLSREAFGNYLLMMGMIVLMICLFFIKS